MKNIKKIIFALTVLLVFSCSTNEDLDYQSKDINSTEARGEGIQSSSGNTGYVGQIYDHVISATYEPGTSETEKKRIRETVLSLRYVVGLRVENIVSNSETWVVSSTLQNINILITTLSSEGGDTDDGNVGGSGLQITIGNTILF